MSEPTTRNNAGLIAGTVCYVVWGFVPLFFQAVASYGAGPWEILAHRIAWGSIAAWVLVLLAKQSAQVAAIFRSPKTLGLLAVSAALIAINWVVYIWAVTSQRTLDASLGYYLVPLINVGAGAVMFRERIGTAAKIAIAVAAIGVVLQGIALGRVPVASLVLAVVWGGYGILRKRVNAEAQAGLLVECLVLAIPAFGYIGWLEGDRRRRAHAQRARRRPLAPAGLAGPVTRSALGVVRSGRRGAFLLSTMGFCTVHRADAQLRHRREEGELLTPLRLASFAFIWVGVAIFAWAAWRKTRRFAAAAAPSRPASAG